MIEVAGDRRRLRFEHVLNFDRDFPQYGTSGGVVRGADPREVWSWPLMWAEALDRMMGDVRDALGPDVSRLRAVSGAAQQHGSVYCTAAMAPRLARLDPGRPLCQQLEAGLSRRRAPVWLDGSTTEQCAAIEAALGGAPAVAKLTGSRACERFTGPQIRRFSERDAAGWGTTDRVHLVSSFMASLLAGAHAPVDCADASGMNLMDLRTLRWASAALDATAPDLERRLPAIAPSSTMAGALSPYWRARYGFPAADVVVWSGDNPSSLVGAGLVTPGRVGISLGTSDTVFAELPQPLPVSTARGASHLFASPTGGYMGLTCFSNGSLAREAVRDQYGLDWAGFSAALANTPAGNRGGLLRPWFVPETTPAADTGVLREGLDPDDAAANVRGVVEAQMMAMANHTEWIARPIARIHAAGGAAANPAILQVMADVFGADVYRAAAVNAAALGAALRAFEADARAHGHACPWPDVVAGLTDPAPGSRIRPVPAHTRVYDDLRRRYAGLEARRV
ncbi:MAG TPA: FGGY-family carbohydrate kinase [Vicinamibacterales bacterium]|nr:FGGY-family carbohydrate kinase [Vicinamibacterales bacterium]